MFHNMQPAFVERMRSLEELDEKDRLDGTPRLQRLGQIPPETGKFLAPMLERARHDERVDALLVPIGRGNWYVGKCDPNFLENHKEILIKIL